MKKLLLGALLVVGATSFGAVSSEVIGGTQQDANDGTAKAALAVRAEGNIVSATDKAYLVLEPTGGVVGSTSLNFIFDKLVKGSSSSSTASFIAKVVKEDVNDKLVELELNAEATMEAKLEVKQAGAVVDPDSTTGITTVKLYDNGGSTTEIGTIGYTLAFVPSSTTTYTGTIAARVDATAEGTFIDDSASVEVTLKNFDYFGK